jgi:Na+/melibiose symporter-like transporter
MDQYQKAGIVAVKELLLQLAVIFTIACAFLAAGYVLVLLTHSVFTAVMSVWGVFIVGALWWFLRETYHRAVKRAKDEAKREADQRRWREEIEKRKL